MKSPLRSLTTLAVVVAILAAGCGSDPDTTSDPETTTTSTTVAAAEDAPPSSSTTTGAETDPPLTGSTTIPSTAAPESAPTPGGAFEEGSVTNADGTTASWALTEVAGDLCFDSTLAHPDPAIAAGLGTGVSDCIGEPGNLSEFEGSLSVSVGVVDGERLFGYLWGRTTSEIISLTIEHTDGSQTPLDLRSGPDGIQVFGVVVDVASLPPVDSLDAVSGTQIEASEPIRDFLRAGPTYPIATTTPVDTTAYPVVP